MSLAMYSHVRHHVLREEGYHATLVCCIVCVRVCVCVRLFFFFLCLRVLFLFFLYFDTGKILVNIYMLSFSTSHFALHSFFFSNICLPTGPHTYTHCPTLLGSFSDKTFSHLNLRLVSSAAILYTALGLLGLAAFFSFSIKLYR